VRVDAALRSFDEVPPWYDPMIGKITAFGPTRETARTTLLNALAATRIDGLTTNLAFLHTLLGSAQFADAAIDTAWLDRHPDLPFAARLAPDGPTPFDLRDGWRLAGPRLPVRVHASQLHSPTDSTASAATAGPAIDGAVRSPMPGTVIAVKVAPGQNVSAGEPLGVVEAMKMEHTLTAPHAGVVAEIGAVVGDRVSIGAQLFLIASPATDSPVTDPPDPTPTPAPAPAGSEGPS